MESGIKLACPAPAKLNLFLHIIGRRTDGYHLLQTLFRFIDLQDTLHFTLRKDGIVRRCNTVADVAEEQDLCVRAAQLLQSETGSSLGVDIGIEKHIPIGGGLGGGSSDAATTLIALNRLWELGLKRNRLMQLGLQLGADVPVFIFGENAFAEGVGELLQAPPGCMVCGTFPAGARADSADFRPSGFDTGYGFHHNARPFGAANSGTRAP